MPDEPSAGIRLDVDGRTVAATAGQSIGSALWAAGVRRFRSTRVGGHPRALYCGIGQCFDCLVTVDGAAPVRACVTPAADGQRIETF